MFLIYPYKYSIRKEWCHKPPGSSRSPSRSFGLDRRGQHGLRQPDVVEHRHHQQKQEAHIFFYGNYQNTERSQTGRDEILTKFLNTWVGSSQGYKQGEIKLIFDFVTFFCINTIPLFIPLSRQFVHLCTQQCCNKDGKWTEDEQKDSSVSENGPKTNTRNLC